MSSDPKRHAVVSQLAVSPNGESLGGGFTLLELMVVISIITILATMGTLASFKAFNVAAVQETRITLAGAKGIADAYESATGQTVNHADDTPIKWSDNKTYNEIQPWTIDSDGDWVYYKNNLGGLDHKRPFENKKINIVNSGAKFFSIERFVWAAMQHPTTKKMLFALDEDAFVDDNENGFMELLDSWGNPLKYSKANDSSLLPPVGDPDLPDFINPFFGSSGEDGQWGTQDDLYTFDLD